MKRFIAMLLTFAVLAGGACCFAAAGGSTNPLVSLTYLLETVKDSINKSAETQADKDIGGLIRGYTERLDAAAKFDVAENNEMKYAGRFTPVDIETGAYITVGEFGCFMPSEGISVLSEVSGEVIDISSGKVISAGTVLTLNHKYFAAEETAARIRAYGKLGGFIDGYYLVGEAEPFEAGEMFCDVINHWAKDYVYELYSAEIVNGVDTHIFEPDTKVNRAMLVTILGRVDGVNTSLYSSVDFNDVDIDEWYGPYVAWAQEAGIVDGYEDGSFKPTANITREQMAAIFERYTNYAGKTLDESEKEQFADYDNISQWAVGAVEFVQRAGLVDGKEGNRFDPLGTATRAEICAVTSRFISRTGIRI